MNKKEERKLLFFNETDEEKTGIADTNMQTYIEQHEIRDEADADEKQLVNEQSVSYTHLQRKSRHFSARRGWRRMAFGVNVPRPPGTAWGVFKRQAYWSVQAACTCGRKKMGNESNLPL